MNRLTIVPRLFECMMFFAVNGAKLDLDVGKLCHDSFLGGVRIAGRKAETSKCSFLVCLLCSCVHIKF